MSKSNTHLSCALVRVTKDFKSVADMTSREAGSNTFHVRAVAKKSSASESHSVNLLGSVRPKNNPTPSAVLLPIVLPWLWRPTNLSPASPNRLPNVLLFV